MKRRIIIIIFIVGSVFSVTGQLIDLQQLYGKWYLKSQISESRIDTLCFTKQNSSENINEWYFDKGKTGWIKDKHEIKEWELKNIEGSNVLLITKEETSDKFIIRRIEEYTILLINENELQLKEGDVTVCKKKIPQMGVLYFTRPENDCDIFSKDSLIFSLNKIKSEYPRIEFSKDSVFSFIYNVQLKTLKDKNSGVWYNKEESDKIQGSWSAFDINKDLTIEYGANIKIYYSVQQEDDLVYLIKKK